MKLEFKIMITGISQHPARIVLTSLAMVAASCIVIWVVSGYDALVSQFHDSAEKTMGRYDMVVVPDSWKEPELDAPLIDELRKDPDISELDPVMQCKMMITRGDGFGGEMMFGPPRRERKRGPSSSVETHPVRRRSGTPNIQNPNGNRPPRFRSGIKSGKHPEYKKSTSGDYQPSTSKRVQPMLRPNPMMMFGSPILVGTNAKEAPNTINSGVWLVPEKDDSLDLDAVISSGVAERLKVDVGGELLVKSSSGEFKLKVVGITVQSSMQVNLNPERMAAPTSVPRGPALMAVYVPMKLAGKISGLRAKISLINICLKKDSNPLKFQDRWSKKLTERNPKAELLNINNLENALERNRAVASVRMQAYSATGMSLMAALFIIFTTLSMGVNERIRQFAILRAVALTRRQVALMIVLESLVLAFIGWGGGFAAGWCLLKIMSRIHPDFFRNGASLGTWCIAFAGASAFGGALLASIVPVWRATKISPLEAFSPPPLFHRSRISSIAIGLGVMLILVNPMLVFVIPMPDSFRYFMHAAIGCTCMAIGFFLLIPLAITLAERIFGPLISKCLLTDTRLLKFQLIGNMWRTVGTTVSLSIGLGLFIATVTWGYSMLQPFVPGDWVPDVLLAFQSGGLPDSELENIRQIKGVCRHQCLPLAVDQPTLANDITGSEQRISVTRQDNVIMIGLDPQAAFGGKNPLLQPKFIQVSAEKAIEKLKQGRYCIVPDHFLKSTGLKIGDSFKMIPPEIPNKPVEYAIAGVVALPGWHWMTKFSGLRMRSGRSAAMIFADFQTVRRDFKIGRINFIWMNIEKDANAEDIGNAVQKIADRNLGERRPVNAQGMWPIGASMFGQSLRMSTRDDVRMRIGSRADGMIWGMCQLPLITLFIASLAVVNTVMASIRARRWEMGVLKAIGTSRFSLVRMILAEAILIGIVACLVSIGFGIMAGWCGTGISQYVSFFGGLDTPLVVPWTKIAFGEGVALLLCFIAALWPAISTGRTETLKLLQEGRASM